MFNKKIENKVLVLLMFTFFTATSGCMPKPCPGLGKISEASLLLSVVKGSRANEYASANVERSQEYLKQAEIFDIEKKNPEASFFASLSEYESRLALAFSKEKENGEYLKSEMRKMDTAKKIMEQEKAEVDKLIEELLK